MMSYICRRVHKNIIEGRIFLCQLMNNYLDIIAYVMDSKKVNDLLVLCALLGIYVYSHLYQVLHHLRRLCFNFSIN